jgi:hypothetical protein
MGDGRTFDQAVRALDKLVSEQTVADDGPYGLRVPDPEPEPEPAIHPAFEALQADSPEPGPAAA